MKRIIRTVAFLSVMGMLATGCQEKDVIIPNQLQNVVTPVCTVHYTINGMAGTATFNSEEEWLLFLERMFALAEEGYSVSFYDGDHQGAVVSSKEKVTYTTRDMDDAIAWANLMVKNGYDVSVEYDNTTGIYTCTAVK